MGDLVNLRRARKAKGLEDKAQHAAENRLRFGRTASERTGQDAAEAKAARDLDGHRLRSPGDEG